MEFGEPVAKHIPVFYFFVAWLPIVLAALVNGFFLFFQIHNCVFAKIWPVVVQVWPIWWVPFFVGVSGYVVKVPLMLQNQSCPTWLCSSARALPNTSSPGRFFMQNSRLILLSIILNINKSLTIDWYGAGPQLHFEARLQGHEEFVNVRACVPLWFQSCFPISQIFECFHLCRCNNILFDYHCLVVHFFPVMMCRLGSMLALAIINWCHGGFVVHTVCCNL